MSKNKAQRRLSYFLDNNSTERALDDPLSKPLWTCENNVSEAFDDSVSERITCISTEQKLVSDSPDTSQDAELEECGL